MTNLTETIRQEAGKYDKEFSTLANQLLKRYNMQTSKELNHLVWKMSKTLPHEVSKVYSEIHYAIDIVCRYKRS